MERSLQRYVPRAIKCGDQTDEYEQYFIYSKTSSQPNSINFFQAQAKSFLNKFSSSAYFLRIILNLSSQRKLSDELVFKFSFFFLLNHFLHHIRWYHHLRSLTFRGRDILSLSMCWA